MKILYGILAGIALLVLAAFVAPSLVDWSSYKPEITSRVEQLTGRKLWIDGDIDVALLPTPKFHLTDARLANSAGARTPDMARFKALNLKLALGPLLSGDFEVKSFELVDPVIELERFEDGSENWRFEPVEDDLARDFSAGRQELEAAEEREVRLDSVEIRNGTIIYRDYQTGRTEFLQQLNVSLSARSLDGPFRSEGSLQVRGQDVAFRVATGVRHGDRPMAVSAEAEIGDENAGAAFEGKIVEAAGSLEFDGAVRASGPNLAELLFALQVAEETPRAGPLAQPFSVKGAVKGSESTIDVRDLQLRLGESQATGAVVLALQEPAQLSVALAVNRIDLDGIVEELGSHGDDTDGGAAPGEPTISAVAPAESSGSDTDLSWLPSDLAASIDVSVDTITYRDGLVRQAQAVLSLDDGVVTIEQVSALLPGGADISVFGHLAEYSGSPSFDGSVHVVADDLRAVMAWLAVEAGGVPADRLRRFSLSGEIIASESNLKLSKLDLQVDASRLEGSVDVARSARTAITANLVLDKFNVDAYFPRAGSDPEASPSYSDAESGGQDAAEPTVDTEPVLDGALSDLQSFDADLNLALGSLNYRGVTISDVKLVSELRDGVLNVSEFAVEDAAGVQLAASGAVRNIAADPAFEVRLQANTETLTRLVQLLEVEPVFRPETLGRVALKGTVAGTLDELNVNTEVKAPAATVSIVGNLLQLRQKPRIGLGFNLRAPDAAELLRIADIAPNKLARRVGALSVNGGLDGEPSSLNLTLSAKARDTELEVAGDVADAWRAPRYDLAVQVTNPSFAAFAELLSGKTLSGREDQVVLMKGRIAGDPSRADISELSAQFGETRFEGNGTVILDNLPPHVEAEIDADLLDLNLFLGAGAASRGTAETDPQQLASAAGTTDLVQAPEAAAPSGQWSREPLDLSFLREISATLGVRADTVLASAYTLENVELALALADGTLNISTLRARIFDGDVEAQGKISDGASVAAEVEFGLSNVDVGAVLRHAAEVKAVEGRATIDGTFVTSGATEYALISALEGQTTVAAGEGSVEGIDLRAISDRLDSLDDMADFLQLADTSLSGGTTRLESLSGTINVLNGVARTEDLEIVAEGGLGAVRGSANLPDWRMDLTALFKLTDHAEAPPLGVQLTGPIDAPRRALLTEEMQAYLATRLAKAVVEEKIVPKLRKGAKAEPGTPADLILRSVFGDPDAAPADASETPPSSTVPVPPLAPQGPEAGRETVAPEEPELAPQDGPKSPRSASVPAVEPPLAPQSEAPERAADPEPLAEPAPVLESEPIPRNADDPLRPQDVLRNLIDRLAD